MKIVFGGSAAEGLAFLKAIRAMAYEHDGAFEVSSGTILATESAIYDSLNAFVSNGNTRTPIELTIFFSIGHTIYECRSVALIPGGAGGLCPAEEEE